MVISGVADRMPDQVDSLVYLDVVESGYAVRTPPFFDPQATPHPLASLLQPLHLAGDLAHLRRRV